MRTAMILAAGLGTRMQPITLEKPKPLVKVAGKPLLQYSLDAAKEVGIRRLVVNVHHLADQMEIYLRDRHGFDIMISDEREELLDSGGGITNALPLIEDDVFLLMNSDMFWFDDQNQQKSNLSAMISRFDESEMDILLMCVPISRTTGHTGNGDFDIDAAGHLTRFNGIDDDALVYGGVTVLHKRIFENISDRKFSFNRCFDEAISRNKLFGYVMHGHWLTAGTVEGISAAEATVKQILSRE